MQLRHETVAWSKRSVHKWWLVLPPQLPSCPAFRQALGHGRTSVSLLLSPVHAYICSMARKDNLNVANPFIGTRRLFIT